MSEEWSPRFHGLKDYRKEALSRNWKDLYRSIQETDRDWVKMEHLRSEIEVSSERGFSTAYFAFVEVYEPPVSGSALGVYQLKTDNKGNYTDLEKFSETIGLGTPTEEKEIDIDNILEHD
jgi:hypothetical protein